jgi:lipid-A-disaccharide synthase
MRVFVVAGEASGDRLASQLLAELERRRYPVAAWGVCGPALRARGVMEVAPAEAVSAVGVVEAIARIPAAFRTLAAVESALARFRPDVVLTVDAPSLSLRVARRARDRGIPAVHWVSPQVWAWRRWRTSAVARAADMILCLFPFEPALYDGLPTRAVYVGHPAVQRLARVTRADAPIAPPPGAAARDVWAGSRPSVVGLAPGSRYDEVRRLWPVMRDVAQRISAARPGTRFVVPVAPTADRSWLGGVACDFVPDLSVAAARADVFVTASGTACLEVAAAGVPQVVVYAVHPITYAVGRLLVRGVDHIALPNILAGARVVPEHLQRLDASRITEDVLSLLGPAGTAQVERLAPVVRPLGSQAIERTADALLSALGRQG